MDIYDEAIAYLTEHISHCWSYPNRYWPGCLFGFATSDRKNNLSADHGCLTMDHG